MEISCIFVYNMQISIDRSKLNQFVEDYSAYEEDDAISVFDNICEVIDQKGIARFSTIFSDWDDRFRKMDFMYDFTSIATELSPLLDFLKSKEGIFVLHFYELDREVEFEYLNDRLEFRFKQSVVDGILFRGALDPVDWERKIENIIAAFKEILAQCFPKALERFMTTGYLFW